MTVNPLYICSSRLLYLISILIIASILLDGSPTRDRCFVIGSAGVADRHTADPSSGLSKIRGNFGFKFEWINSQTQVLEKTPLITL